MVTTSDYLERPTYRRDGGVKWGRLLLVLPFVLVVALGMAAAVNWFFHMGWYIVLLVPIVAALPVAGATYLAIKISHCRNNGVAIFLGLFAGLALYPGWFHLHMVSLAGMPAVHRVDLLPRFIHFRLRNDVAGEIGKPGNAPNVVTNSIFFAIELLIVSCFTIGAAVCRVMRVYCPSCGEWARLAMHSAPAGSATLIQQLLNQNRIDQLPEIPKIPPQVNDPSSTITVEACRQAGRNLSCCAFLTLKENPGSKGKAIQSGPAIMNQAAITRDEIGYIASRVSGLVALAPAGFMASPPPAFSAAVTTPAHRAPSGEVARAETVSETDASTIYSTKSASFLAALSFIPVIAVVVGAVLLLLAWKFWPGFKPDSKAWMLSVASLVLGACSLIFGLVVCWTNVDYFNTQRKYVWVLDLITQRPNSIVPPEDSQTFFVEVVPREFWTNTITRLPVDGGFATVDESRKLLLFEGLKERYRIPGSAILSCEVVNTSPDAGRFSFFATVIQARSASQDSGEFDSEPIWEISFMVRPTRFEKYSGVTRKLSCENLKACIDRIASAR